MEPTAVFGPVRIYAGDKNGKYPDGHQLIVQGSEARAVFDSPIVANRIGEDFDGADLVIQGHMHEDHIAGLHRIPQVPVYVHELDLPAMRSWSGLRSAYGYADEVCEELRARIEQQFNYLPRPDATGYEDGASWDLGGVTVTAIHLPGHTAGHCTLLVEPGGLLFIGDIDLSGFGPFYGDRTSNMEAFRESLAQLPEIPAEVWVTSHHRGIYTDRQDFLRDLAEFGGKIDTRSQRLQDMLQGTPQTLEELAARGILYNTDDPPVWTRDVERWTISQHLQELQSQGLVTQGDDGRFVSTRDKP